MSAWAILLAVIALNLGNVYISMRINAWNNAFYNALQAFDSGELLRQFGTFCILVAFAVAMSVYSLFLTISCSRFQAGARMHFLKRAGRFSHKAGQRTTGRRKEVMRFR